jgi:Ca2+-binding EF-hand superfamily protein
MAHPTHISHNEKEMIYKSQRLLDSGKIQDPIVALRHLCLARGFSGFLRFGRCFREIDDNGKMVMNLNQFAEAMDNTGFELNDEQVEDIFRRFDLDGSGGINSHNLMDCIKPEMSASRHAIVHAAFHKMDKEDVGVISMKTLKHYYDVHSNPRFTSGVQSEEAIVKTFIDHFEENNHVNGEVTKEDFENYYAALSASVEDDTYFDLVIRQVYKL